MLPCEVMILGIEQDALLAARIIHNRAADLCAIGAADDQTTHRIGAVIEA